jgi:hypothetical protein
MRIGSGRKGTEERVAEYCAGSATHREPIKSEITSGQQSKALLSEISSPD